MIGARDDRGFTLVELLVVIAVIAVLVGIAVPALQSARQAALSVACQQNIRSLHLGTMGYLNDHDGVLPWAEVLTDYTGGHEEPLPALEAYLDATLPRLDAQGAVVTGGAWLCPADHEWAVVTGISYDYFPAAVMGYLGQRETSQLFRESPTVTLWIEHHLWHAGWQNYVRYDGALGKRRRAH